MAFSNYIDESERTFSTTTSVQISNNLWSSNGTLDTDAVIYQDAAYGSLKASGQQNLQISYNVWGDPSSDIPSQYAITAVDDIQDFIESFVWIRATQDCTVSMRNVATLVEYDSVGQQYILSTDPLDVHEGEYSQKTISYGSNDDARWTLLRAPRLRIPEGDGLFYSLGLEILVGFDDANGVANISRPTITFLGDIEKNLFARRCWAGIPDVFVEQDFYGEPDAISLPLIRLIDICTNNADIVDTKTTEIDFLNSEDTSNQTVLSLSSTLVNPLSAYSSEVLEWLSHFRGRDLIVTYEPSTEGESWVTLKLDDATEGKLDDVAVLASSLVPSTGFTGGVDAYFRWQVQTGFYGHNAGTITAMVSAIQLLLTGNKTVTYTFPSTNTIKFFTKVSETYDADVLSVGDSSDYILSVIEPARPLGTIIMHELVA